MSRERTGLLIGTATLVCAFLPYQLFVFAVALLSLLIAKEVASALDVEEVSYYAFFVPLIYVSMDSLTLPVVGLLSLAYGYKRWSLDGFMQAFLVLMYAGFLPSFLVDVRALGFKPLLVLILGVWAIDVSAYYIGRRFGKTPVFPKISPKKTLEGYLGAFAVSWAVLWTLSGWGMVKSLSVALLILFFAAVGDYFKSFIKRQLGIKDFSQALGSHGGFTDRFDSLIFAAPAYLFVLQRASA